ncbi:primosomal replication protein PriC [Thalassotalea litorea]|uniref:primosomal replication protein PriC n=1 Tax=Thalassotalea litorea TaxID=2020715 RepID=UPI003735C409
MRVEIQRLHQLLERLVDDAKVADERNKNRKSHYYLQRQALFDDRLFNRSFDNYSDYLPGIRRKLDQLQTLLDNKQQELGFSLLEQLQHQISSLITAIKANESRHQDSEYRLQRRKRLSTKQVKKVAQTLIQPTQQLYQKLAEYQGFEKRLEQMLFDEQDKLNRASKQDAGLQQTVLTLHQRLGRCRQAIARLESDIERQEKR